MEELSYKQLAELLLAHGELSIQEAEELMGGDIDDSNPEWESDDHLMKIGENPAALKAARSLDGIAEGRMQKITRELFEDLEKSVGGKYTSKHMTSGGNWSYTYSTGTGATQRSDNKGSKSTAPQKDKSTQTDSHINYRAHVGGKTYGIKAKNPRQKALLEKARQRLRGKAALSS